MAKESEVLIRARMDSKQAVKGSKETQKAVKDIADSTNKTKKEVKSLGTETTAVSGILQSSFGSHIPVIGKFTGEIEKARKAKVALTASTKAFRVALAATGIGAIVVALGALFQAFRSTQEGADRINRVMEPTKAVFDAFWGVIQNVALFMSDSLVSAFNDPIGTAKELGSALVQNVINRFKAVVDLGGAVGKVIKGVILRDFDLLKEGAGEAGNAIVQMNTGIEDSGEKLAGWGRNIKEASQEAFESGQRIQSLTEQIENLRIEQEVPLSKLNREYREMINIARDSQVTEEERLEAIDRALEARREITAEELKILDLEIERMALQQSFNDTSREEALELEKLKAQREELIANTERELGRRISMRNSIITGIEEEAEKEAEVEKQKIEALNQRADKYRELALTEEELRQAAFDNELAGLQELLEQEVITREEFQEIRRAMEDRFLAEEKEKEEARAGSIIAIEEQLAQAKISYRQAVSDADRAMHADEIARIQDRLNAITAAGKSERTEKEKTFRESVEGQVSYANSVKETGKGILDTIISEIIARQLASVISSVPFPLNLAVAPAAALATKSLLSAVIPGYLEGGMTEPGQKVITVNEDGRPEYIVNAESTRQALPLLEEINNNPGFGRNLMQGLQHNQFQNGGPTSRPVTGADVPVPSSGNNNSELSAAIREGMQGVIVEARVAVTELREELNNYEQLQEDLG